MRRSFLHVSYGYWLQRRLPSQQKDRRDSWLHKKRRGRIESYVNRCGALIFHRDVEHFSTYG